VYSKFGKKHFLSDEKTVNPAEKIAQMYNVVNSCNLRRLIRQNEGDNLFNLANHKNFEKIPDPYYTPQDPSDKTLVFESRIECGNLSLGIKVIKFFLML
jgi:hypothetical protein